LIKLRTLSNDAYFDEKDYPIINPGPPPILMFMPTKDQIRRMILKATRFDG